MACVSDFLSADRKTKSVVKFDASQASERLRCTAEEADDAVKKENKKMEAKKYVAPKMYRLRRAYAAGGH